MPHYFRYTRKQRRMSITLLLNALVVYCMYLAAMHYLPRFDPHAAAEIIAVADIVIWPVEAILIGLAAYFWFENKQVELWVTPSELHYFDPTFSDYGWTVKTKDIAEIEQFSDVNKTYTVTQVVLHTGETKQINYSCLPIDRRAFFDALKKGNSTIKLPSNPYLYKSRKPKWALKWLGRK